MLYRFSPPPTVDSPLARLDTRWRLVGLLLLSISIALVRSWQVAVAAVVCSLILSRLALVPWRWYRNGLIGIMSVVALFALPVPLLAGLDLGDGLSLVLLMFAKAVALYTVTAVLLVSAPLEESLKAARALYIPGVFIQLTLLTYRYLFLLAAEMGRLRVALRVRGFRNRPNLHSYRTVSSAAGTLLVRGHDRGERVAQAMRCRGFDGRFRTLHESSTRWLDILACTLLILASLGFLLLDAVLVPSFGGVHVP